MPIPAISILPDDEAIAADAGVLIAIPDTVELEGMLMSWCLAFKAMTLVMLQSSKPRSRL